MSNIRNESNGPIRLEMFKTPESIREEMGNRDLYFWGVGEWFEKTIRRCGLRPKYVVDSNPALTGGTTMGVPIVSPETFFRDKQPKYLVITTGSYESVVEALIRKGVSESCYCCTPLLKNMYLGRRLKCVDQTLVFSVADQETGGIFRYRIRDKTLTRWYQGKCRGLIRYPGGYAFVDELHGMRLMDKKGNIFQSFDFPEVNSLVGLTYDEDHRRFYIVDSGRDKILVVSEEGELEKMLSFSEKYEEDGIEHHHLNDICYYEGRLYLSLFSLSGTWQIGGYDGCIVETDLSLQRISSPLVSNLWMPHTITYINNELFYVESMRGRIVRNTWMEVVRYPAFIRGFAWDGQFYYVGQSENRYYDRLAREASVIPVTCCIHVFDPESRASREHVFDQFENIHDIVIAHSSV